MTTLTRFRAAVTNVHDTNELLGIFFTVHLDPEDSGRSLLEDRREKEWRDTTTRALDLLLQYHPELNFTASHMVNVR